MKFAVINDIHAQFVANPQHPGYPGANGRAEWMLAQFAKGGSLADMDFVVGAGDLIHGETIQSISAELKALQPYLRKLFMPFYPCCGNHEIRQNEGDRAFERPYATAYGADKFDYAISLPAAEIIVLNNAGTYHLTTQRREERALKFQAMLEARPGVPKILICHIPLVSMRDRDVLHESFGFRSYRCLEVEILDLLDTHGADVRLVISGHLHLTGMVKRRGVRHLVTAGTASFPHDYAVITVTKQGIAVEVRNLPKALHEPASNIHGPPRYVKGYTDPAHKTHQSYLRGLASERKFSIPL
jgi:predicted phosphodiesterase